MRVCHSVGLCVCVSLTMFFCCCLAVFPLLSRCGPGVVSLLPPCCPVVVKLVGLRVRVRVRVRVRGVIVFLFCL